MVALTQRLRSDLLRRRAVERALRISERHYRSLFESANDAIIVFEPGRETILEANPAAAKLYGFSRRALIGRSLLCLTADVVAGRRKIRALLASGGPRAFETIHYRKDGTPLILAGSASVIEHGGRRAIRSIIRDITAQKKAELALRESEQRLRTAMNASLDAIYLMASVRNGRGRIVDFRFTDVNARGLALASADRATLIGAHVTRLFPAVRRRGLFDRYVRVAETGQPLEETFLLESPGPDVKWREPKWLHHQIVRLADGVLITTRDVTEQKRTELALRALPHRISQAQEAERRGVARDLHDSVSQLLASAKFRIQQVQELARNGGDDALATHAARANFALQSAAGEVRRISHRLRPRELDDLGLSAALHILLAEFRSRTGLRTVLSPRNSRPKIPAPVAEALYRIAQEALTNIERHARARRVRLSLRQTPAHATLIITDDGRGLPRAGRRHATGLGLLHMRERAELAGGSFTLSSAARRGTKLVAKIPLRPRKNSTEHA